MTTTDTAAAAIEAAYSLLGFIFDADDLIEFRTLGKVVGSTWAKQRDAAQAIAKLATLGHGVQVYFGANPRRRRGGKADDVTAHLSGGEHVFDAEVVAMLGDGNTEAGHKLLEELKARVRAYKRQAPAGRPAPSLELEQGGPDRD